MGTMAPAAALVTKLHAASSQAASFVSTAYMPCSSGYGSEPESDRILACLRQGDLAGDEPPH